MTLHSLTCSERVVLNGEYVRAIVPLQCRRARFDPWVGKIPWKRKWQPTLVFLPREFHRHWSLAGEYICVCVYIYKMRGETGVLYKFFIMVGPNQIQLLI